MHITCRYMFCQEAAWFRPSKQFDFFLIIEFGAGFATPNSIVIGESGSSGDSGFCWNGTYGKSAFYDHRDALAAANAQGCQTIVGLSPAHFVEQCDKHSRTTGPDWMTKGNRPTIDIEFCPVEA